MVKQEVVFDSMAWIETIVWSLTFYAQICLNYSLKNVEGLNLDYLLLQGFAAYTIYSSYGYWVDSTDTGVVTLADLIFPVHALGATLFTYFQTYIYPRGSNSESRQTMVFCGMCWGFMLVYMTLNKAGQINPSPKWSWVSLTGYFKLITTAMKYFPQFYWNCVRQTTYGWSIHEVLLDFAGAFLCVEEVVLRWMFSDSYRFNLTKFGLGVIATTYNTIYIVQHFCLYGPVPQEEAGELIEGEE